MPTHRLAAMTAPLLAAAVLMAAGEPPFGVNETCNNSDGRVARCSDALLARRLRLVTSVDERFTPDREGYIRIDVVFSRPIDRASVVPGRTLILDAPLDHNAAVKVLFSDAAFTVISEKRRSELFPPGRSNIDFTFTLKGASRDGGDVVKALDGSVLRGKNGGLQEGDYVVHYLCRNMDPFWC